MEDRENTAWRSDESIIENVISDFLEQKEKYYKIVKQVKFKQKRDSRKSSSSSDKNKKIPETLVNDVEDFNRIKNRVTDLSNQNTMIEQSNDKKFMTLSNNIRKVNCVKLMKIDERFQRHFMQLEKQG